MHRDLENSHRFEIDAIGGAVVRARPHVIHWRYTEPREYLSSSSAVSQSESPLLTGC